MKLAYLFAEECSLRHQYVVAHGRTSRFAWFSSSAVEYFHAGGNAS
jgi:hypothetical protein